MNTPQKILFTAIAVAVLQACTSVPIENANLTAAQSEFKAAQDTPSVAALAGAELGDAKATLDQANDIWATQGSRSDVDHLAYMASKKVAIARTAASQRQAEKAIDAAQSQRQQTLLIARTAEAENAQRSAQDSRIAADSATQQAQAAMAQTALARQDAQAANANAAQLQDRLAELKAKQTDRGMVVTIGDLLFDNNSAVLKPAAEQSVSRLAAFLKAYPLRVALVEGYTDSVGSADSNQRLSERRADSVRSALRMDGIDSSRLDARGYGDNYPVGNNQSAEGRLSNRRVEVVLSDDSGKVLPR